MEEENEVRTRVLTDEPLGDRATRGGAGGMGGSRVQVRGLEGAPVPFWGDGILSGGPGGVAEVAGLLHLSNEVQHKVTAQQILPCVASEHGDRPPSSLLVTASARGKVSRQAGERDRKEIVTFSFFLPCLSWLKSFRFRV